MNSPNAGDPQGRFELPPDVAFHKQRLADGWAYVFRNRTLGELGRVLVQGSSPNRVGRKPPVRASKPFDFRGFLLLLGVRIPA